MQARAQQWSRDVWIVEVKIQVFFKIPIGERSCFLRNDMTVGKVGMDMIVWSSDSMALTVAVAWIRG